MSQISALLVDDDIRVAELIGAVLSQQGFRVTLAESARAALVELRNETYEAVVTDMLFDGAPDGSRVLAAARELQPTCVVIVMTGYPALDGAVAAVKSGANDYLPKPVNPILLAAKIHRALREREMDQANLEFTELIEILSGMIANTIERIDPYTAGHGERTRRYCLELAKRLDFDGATRNQLQLAAIAHDYGKIYLEDQSFLTKNGPLTRDEYAEVQRHPLIGAEKLGTHRRLRKICRTIAEHHEKFDGNGYPHGLAGAEISLPGRVLGIAEVFDSLATRRAYKQAWPLSKIVPFFEEQRGRSFDPELTDEFLVLLDRHGEEWTCEQAREPVGAVAPLGEPRPRNRPGAPEGRGSRGGGDAQGVPVARPGGLCNICGFARYLRGGSGTRIRPAPDRAARRGPRPGPSPPGPEPHSRSP